MEAPFRTSSPILKYLSGKYLRWSSGVVKPLFLWFTITLRVFWIAWVAWLVLVRGFARCLCQTLAWVVWVVWVHKNFGVKKTWLKHDLVKTWFYKLSLWLSEILRVILVSSLYFLHMSYCNKLSIQFTVFYVNPYSIVFMRSHYFPKSKDYVKSC